MRTVGSAQAENEPLAAETASTDASMNTAWGRLAATSNDSVWVRVMVPLPRLQSGSLPPKQANSWGSTGVRSRSAGLITACSSAVLPAGRLTDTVPVSCTGTIVSAGPEAWK